MCDFRPMILWLALRRLLVILAVISVALAPATASAVPAGDAAFMASMGGDTAAVADPANDAMADMPCCPPDEPMMPDCQKGCPLAALCLAKVALRLPVATAIPVRVAATPSQVVWRTEAMFTSLALRPPPEPPRS